MAATQPHEGRGPDRAARSGAGSARQLVLDEPTAHGRSRAGALRRDPPFALAASPRPRPRISGRSIPATPRRESLPITSTRTTTREPSWPSERSRSTRAGTRGSSRARLTDRAWRCCAKSFRASPRGGPRQPAPRITALATQAPAPSDDDLAIRWSWSAERIERRVRAASPWPGAWTEIGDRIVTLVRVRPTAAVPRALAPAEATVRTDGTAVVRAADAGVELLEARDASDAPMSREDLARLVRAVRQA